MLWLRVQGGGLFDPRVMWQWQQQIGIIYIFLRTHSLVPWLTQDTGLCSSKWGRPHTETWGHAAQVTLKQAFMLPPKVLKKGWCVTKVMTPSAFRAVRRWVAGVFSEPLGPSSRPQGRTQRTHKSWQRQGAWLVVSGHLENKAILWCKLSGVLNCITSTQNYRAWATQLQRIPSCLWKYKARSQPHSYMANTSLLPQFAPLY